MCAPTGELPPPSPKRADREGDPRVMMPRRKTTRAENRAKYLAAERARNKRLREARRKAWREVYFPTIAASDSDDDDPPPF
ncbi:MAG: hypothetical protein ACXVX5_02700 [Mycobacterium sp.]